jgi:hypothetical protein
MSEIQPQDPAQHVPGAPPGPHRGYDEHGVAEGEVAEERRLDDAQVHGRYDEGEVAEEVIVEEEGVHGRFDEGQASDATLDAEEGVQGSFDEGQASDDTPSPAP